jgi:hypothetical protein
MSTWSKELSWFEDVMIGYKNSAILAQNRQEDILYFSSCKIGNARLACETI